jgi:hypothetical protein
MIWGFLVLGVSTLVVVCVMLALYMHLRKNLQKSQGPHNDIHDEGQGEHRVDKLDR